MESKKQLLIIGPPIFNGMAGSKRILNLVKQLNSTELWSVYCYSTGYTKPINFDGVFLQSNYLLLLKDIIQTSYNEKYMYHYGYINIYTLLPIAIAKLKRYKVILDLVEDLHIDHGNRGLKYFVKYKLGLLFYKLIPLFIDGIIVISNHLYKKIRKDFRNIKIKLIPISVDIEKFNLHGKKKKTVKKNFFTVVHLLQKMVLRMYWKLLKIFVKINMNVNFY